MSDYFRELLIRHKTEYDGRDRAAWRKPSPDAPPTAYYFGAYVENIGAAPVLREARALRRFMENCGIHVSPNELVAGQKSPTDREVAMFYYGGGTYIRDNVVWEYAARLDAAGEREAFLANVGRVKERKYMNPWDPDFDRLHPDFFTAEEWAGFRTGAAGSTCFGCHMVIDHESVLKGVSHRRREIAEQRALPSHAGDADQEFYDGMDEILTAFSTMISRNAEACLEAAGRAEGAARRNMLDLYGDLTRIATDPPETFRQALQLVWLAHVMADTDTFGRFDKYLYPFYARDAERGVLTREDALCLLQSLMIKIDEAGDIQNMTIGGVYPDGSPCCNELTGLVLEAVRTMRYKGPNLCFRIGKDMPEHMWEELLETLMTGQGLPALYSDEVMTGQLMASGIPPEDALDFCLAGCSQIMIPGKAQFCNDIGIMNAAKILELTLYNGADAAMSGAEAGLKTGDAAGFAAFDELMRAFKKQLTYFAELEARVNNKIVALLGRTEGFAFRSLYVRDCQANAKGVFGGGAVYNNVELECVGLTNAADSLAAVKKVVFEDRAADMAELRGALLANFEGYGLLRRRLLNAPKFGNDAEAVDGIRREITEHLYAELRRQKGVLGGNYVPGEVIFTVHDSAGKATGATPDGRLKGEVLADSAGASQGMDRSGPTALLNSVLKIPTDGLCTSVVCNMKFDRRLFGENREKIGALLSSFFGRGGQQIQVNVCDRLTLLAALERPEDYRGLVVRVGGYSAYFDTLSRRLQEEIIERREY